MKAIPKLVTAVDKRLLTPRRSILPYVFDLAMARCINPSDTLIVSGFARSGTTWLEETLSRALDAKTVHEPLHPRLRKVNVILSRFQLPSLERFFLELFMPYWEGPDDSELHRYLNRALRGGLRGAALLRCRTGVSQSLRRRVVVKLIRGHLCLHGIQKAFENPVIHIFRDPRAVVASFKRTSWGPRLLNELSLKQQLLEPKDGRLAYYSRWKDEIIKYDEENAIVKITAYWALTERFVIDQRNSGGMARTELVSYEELCRRDGNELLLEILDELILEHDHPKSISLLTRDSHSTESDRLGISTTERVLGWKEELSGEEISVIESIIAHFDLEDRLFDAMEQHALDD